MRLKAKTELTYAGKNWRPGDVFDALEQQALDLINRDQAQPYNLEDPATISLQDRVENLLPPLPDVPPVTISPTFATVAALGGTGILTVTITGEGTSGTWTVDKDSTATWLTVTSPTTPQSSSGPINYDVSPNLGVERVAHLYINGKTFTVTQFGV
jgi:hypothetical protein